jgi:hypothetical protein
MKQRTRIGTQAAALLATLLVAAFIAGCVGNSRITSSNVNPLLIERDLQGVLVVAVARQPSARKDFEDAFTKALNRHGAGAVASHTLLPESGATAEQVIAAARKANLETILVTRYLGESTEEVYHPGTIYYDVAPAYGRPYAGGFGGYYGYAYEVAYDQPVWTSNVTHTLVSDLYETESAKPIWQAVSETVKASSDNKLRNDAINGLIGDLKKQGLLN